MRKLHWIIGSVVASMSWAGTVQAAETCELTKFDYIYNKTFTSGDGEGMETYTCKESNFRHGDSVYQEVKALAGAGKYKEAETGAYSTRVTEETSTWNPENEVCVRPSLEKPFRTLVDQIAKHNADAAEKAGELAAAIRIHDSYCQFAEAARGHVIRVKGAQFQQHGYSQEREFQEAYAYSKAHPFESFIKELRQVAASRVERFRQIEEKFFAPYMYAPKNLVYAIEWLPYAGDDGSQKKAIMAFSERRGDTLAPPEGCNNMGPTIEYYKISSNQQKVKQATAKAMQMSAGFEAQGAYPAAAKCYEAAGAQDKAAHAEEMGNAKREQNAEAYEKNEKTRKEKFSKDQDNLEKELGF